jgi:catechol 2,3-dioxygenase
MLEEAQDAGQPWTGLPAGTRLGHMHLQVGDINQAVDFYHGILGFDIVAQMPTALFVSAGGYHHHIGMNIWHSKGADPTPKDMAGLRFFTIDFAGEPARAETLSRLAEAGVPFTRSGADIVLQDPWHTTIVLQAGTASDVKTATELDTVALTA